MAKLPRTFQAQFGVNGNQSHYGQFGSRAAGSPLPTKDPATIQALTAFLQNGWLDAINAGNKAPFLEDMNGLFYLLFYQMCYQFQEGIPEWNSGTTYYVGSIVKKPGTTEQYGSLTDGNLNNALPNQTANGNWNYLNPQSVATGIISAAGAGTPFGYLPCDGSSFVNASFPALATYLAAAPVWRTFNGAADPGAGNSRTPDLRSVTLLGIGQGAGFSARVLGQLVGEENHLLVTGEIPAHAHPLLQNYVFDQGSSIGYFIAGVASINSYGSGGSIQGRGAAATTGNAGGGAAHNNMQPSVGINYVIKT